MWNRVLQVWPENEIGAVIIVPSRELAKQVGTVCKFFADALSLSMCVMIGGKTGKGNSKLTQSLKFVLLPPFFIK